MQVVQKQTLGERDGNLNDLLMARCVRNICTKNYLKKLLILLQVTVDNVGILF